MTTIDKLDISVNNLYAIRKMMVEQTYLQYHLEEAASIPAQTQVIDFFPKPSEMDILLGTVPLNAPWAYFFPHKRFKSLRRSSFAFFRVAPSLGPLDDHAKLVALLTGVYCETAEEAAEQASILSCFSQLETINGWQAFILGKRGQFLQA